MLLAVDPPVSLQTILHFEGPRGPDSARLKKDGQEVPWHFYQPSENDQELLQTINAHREELVNSLRASDKVRSAFEAAWLAHALVDGLTPAHHFPYEAELEQLHGRSKEMRTGARKYFLVKGNSRRDSMLRSLKLIGPKGLLTTHTTFEAGAAMIILPLRLASALPTPAELARLKQTSLVGQFEILAGEVEGFHLYERFYDRGWTPKLARDVRRELAPRMVKMVTLAWYDTCTKAGYKGKPHARH
jgi:hypothetical protein